MGRPDKEMTTLCADPPAGCQPSHERLIHTKRSPRPDGEISFHVFSRDRVTLSSYNDDAICTKVETWGDSVATRNYSDIKKSRA
jgi:hypothetical protein